MTKGELRTMIRDVINEELERGKLHEAAQSGRWAIRAWTSIEDRRAGAEPIYDSINGKGKSFNDFTTALAALRSKDLMPAGEDDTISPSAFEIFYIADASTYNKGKSKVVHTKL